ncbi:MAG TPA: radical SAM protein [Campylobacterales bacterium]|nr:radical SAM protein [Campylobacterales bacterium]
MKLSLPKPQPEYDDVIRRGFDRFAARYENYLKYMQNPKSCRPNYLPIKMDIENVSRCNLSCNMCLVSLTKTQKRADDLSLEDFKAILDEQIGVFEIKIQGIGEPFLHKDFIQMVSYAVKKDIWTRSTTNATLLHIDDNYKKIIDAGIGELQISVDGTRKESYEGIRKGARFERVVENCKLINEYCASLGVEKTRMWSLIQKDNIAELKDFPRFAKELGFNRLTLSLDVNGWGDEELTLRNKDKNVASLLNESIAAEVLEISKDIGIDTTFWDISTKYSKQNLCPWPFERVFVSSDKKAIPCCMIANPDIFSFGEIGSFNDIWDGDKYIEFRQAHLSGNIPPVCKFCYENMK